MKGLKATLALAVAAASIAGCGDDGKTKTTGLPPEYTQLTTPKPPGPTTPTTPGGPKESPDQAAAKAAVSAYLTAIGNKDAKKVCESLEKASPNCEAETKKSLDALPKKDLDGFKAARVQSVTITRDKGSAVVTFESTTLSIPVKKVAGKWKISESTTGTTAPPTTPTTPSKPPSTTSPEFPPPPQD